MIMNQKELTSTTHFSRKADLEKWLISNNVPYLYGKHGTLITSEAAINKVLLSKSEVDIEFK